MKERRGIGTMPSFPFGPTFGVSVHQVLLLWSE